MTLENHVYNYHFRLTKEQAERMIELVEQGVAFRVHYLDEQLPAIEDTAIREAVEASKQRDLELVKAVKGFAVY